MLCQLFLSQPFVLAKVFKKFTYFLLIHPQFSFRKNHNRISDEIPRHKTRIAVIYVWTHHVCRNLMVICKISSILRFDCLRLFQLNPIRSATLQRSAELNQRFHADMLVLTHAGNHIGIRPAANLRFSFLLLRSLSMYQSD